MKKLIISENEKIRIKSLYDIIEQTENEKTFGKFIDLMMKDSPKDKTNSDIGDDTDNEDNEKVDYSTKNLTDTSDKFIEVTKKVIEKFEGGYWNPICSKYPNTRHPKKEGAYLNSGETMFGLDRVAGSIEKWSSAGRQFFGLIDKEKERLGEEKFCNTWKWNYIPPDPLKSELMNLAAETMKTAYENNVKTFFKGDTKKVVDSSRALLLHFSYATWNGPGFFQKFANTINKGVAEGKSIKSLIELAKQDRLKRISGYWAEGSKRVNAAIDQEAQIDNVS
jgi:hypothetical protein